MKQPGPGRPRSEETHRAILQAALAEVERTGFRALTVDAIAARAKAGKTTVYRRWPNKAAVVMDALFGLVGPGSEFPPAMTALKRMRKHLRWLGEFFRGRYGRMIRELLGEAQFDAELAEILRKRWIGPQRETARRILQQAVGEKGLRREVNLETALDLFYGPLYYRLQTGVGELGGDFAEEVFGRVVKGLRPPRGER